MNRLKERLRPYYLRWVYFRLFPGRRPARFTDCWRYPFERLPAEHLTGIDAGASVVVFYPMNDWHFRFQRTHHLARALARRGHVAVYLNPHFGRQYETVPFVDRAPRLARLEPGIFELHVRLPREPVFHHRALTARESRAVAAAVELVLAAMAPRRVAQIVSFPVWSDAARLLRARHGYPILYDCHDLLSGFGNVADELVRREAEAMDGSDLALFSSFPLLEEFCSRNPRLRERSRLLRNAVDVERFPFPSAPGAPVAVYAGAMDAWFDAAAVRAAALRNPGCRFLLAGSVDAAPVRALGSLPNVEFAGEAPYGLVPEVLARGRVGIIPFLVNKLTRATNPIKLYEYFACGLPVVSAPLPEVEAFGDLVYIAGSPEEFAAAVQRALEEDDSARRFARRQIAERESWAARAAAIEAEWDALGHATPA